MQQCGCDHDGLVPEEICTVPGSVWKQSLSHALKSLPGLTRGDGIPHLTQHTHCSSVSGKQCRHHLGSSAGTLMEGMLTYAMQPQAAQALSFWVPTWLHIMKAWQATLALNGQANTSWVGVQSSHAKQSSNAGCCKRLTFAAP